MAKFKFPLEPARKHRKLKEEIAQKDFQEANAILQNEISALNEMLESKSNSHKQVQILITQTKDSVPAALQQIHQYQTGQDVRIELQRQKVEKQEKLVEDKREILRQMAVEYKIIDKFRERKFEEFKQEQLREEIKEQDEQNVLRFGSKERQR